MVKRSYGWMCTTWVGIATLLGFISLSAIKAQAPPPPDRSSDPVMLTGSQIPGLLGQAPGTMVGFRWNTATASWVQIPIQVDERHVVDFGTVYNSTLQGATFLAYSDPNTWTGADPNATFDSDDELVFMWADAGDIIPLGVPAPAGTLAATGQAVTIHDPLGNLDRQVALYITDGTLNPAAGRANIDYQFHLNA